ncbi:MAG TPA: reductive dehalogenase domain-containing protein [Burkholderiales bacterium]|nr:reductive dehalogenase domain-containing protein [Burkholderiales bacterium]
MARLFSNRERPYDMGVLPTELLARDPHLAILGASMPGDAVQPRPDSIVAAIPEYLDLCVKFFDGEVAPKRAPVPDDPLTRARNLKASAYFLDATLAGVCLVENVHWISPNHPPHTHAFVFLVEFGREPKAGEPGAEWIRGTNAVRTDVRCAEVAVVLAGYLRTLGWSARGHIAGETLVSIERLAQRAGVAKSIDGVLKAPLIGRGFRLGVVTTDFEMASDSPLASLDWPSASAYLGKPGTRPGWTEAVEAKRPVHMGRYEMERIKRVDEPTTLILRDEIRRMPKRADLFSRALAGDLGEKLARERRRFAVKHPLAFAMTPLIRNMVPMQGTRESLGGNAKHADPVFNSNSVKALGYYMGADLVGICRAEPWMYYSHDDEKGEPIEPYHPWAVVMLIDQGFETMEGASGDDWISGAQSMRAYMRGALIAGIMAAHLRRLGWSARVHSNAYSEVLHIPAVLMAGLGELSRIGELVLNPFIGPRSKSIVFTTDMPLQADQPIDFGLQAVCAMCLKCARECPCNAIPFGPKVMFNGYEMWKPDVEKCGRYRLSNDKGSACGRCMKTCPYNREDLVESERLLWLSIEVPQSRRALIDYDDAAGGGSRNLVKRWWFDLEIVGREVVKPRGTNERDLDLGRTEKLARTQKLAFFPPPLQPAGGTTLQTAVPIDRAAGLAAYAAAESPAAARKRTS